MCKSLALEIRVTSPMLAALFTTSPPDLRLVMFWSPMLIGAASDVDRVRTEFHFGPFVVLEMEWMSTKSLFTSYLTTPSASTEAVVFFTVCEVQTFIQCNFLFVCAIRFVSQRNLFSSFVAIECYLVCSVMICFIFVQVYKVIGLLLLFVLFYSNCFTSCIFYVVTGYVYFVSCTSFTGIDRLLLGDTLAIFCR